MEQRLKIHNCDLMHNHLDVVVDYYYYHDVELRDEQIPQDILYCIDVDELRHVQQQQLHYFELVVRI